MIHHTANRISDDCVPSVKGIPVIIYAILRQNAQRFLRYNDGKH